MSLIKAARMVSATALVITTSLAGAAATATAVAAEQKTLPLHQPTPITAKDYEHGQCPGVPADKDGWHFVLPTNGVDFVQLKVTFQPGGVQTITAFGPPTDKHAYATSAPGAQLVAATALVTGEAGALAKVDWFNLSHTCPGTPGGTPTPTPTPKPTGPSETPRPHPTKTATPPPGQTPPPPGASPTPTRPGASPTPSSTPSAGPSGPDDENPTPSNPDGDLPLTGAPTLVMAGVAALLLAGGTAAVLITRRSRTSSEGTHRA
ncbi:LPXTG cell wall anchor domain-containing protein [Thermomonospora umbrina]|uniref:LPXTG-motif cell wall-anchored protein n=1 Tax=Thermomonospora umbrina TaxID=111806 RepID=A0A3D9SM59_9ACTN|nr:LPXTG cell wall anchor domain-containing protein [Thermomonospora umbrina]REE97016.1 hypothetical protein DFJ69_2471 [Thermomonospora umbrina]